MDKSESRKKEHHNICNKTQAVIKCKAIIECETTCRDILKCIHEPIAPVKVKKERELLKGVTEYFIFWN